MKLRIVCLIPVLAAACLAAWPGDTSLESRLDDRLAVERLRHAMREGASEPDEALLRERMRRSVEDTLRLSVALDAVWQRPLTRTDLRREMHRIVRESRFPARLREMFTVLGDDSRRIQETLAWPGLAETTARALFRSEPPADSIAESFEDWWTRSRDRFTADADALDLADPDWSVEEAASSLATVDPSCVPDDSWANGALDDLVERGGHSMIWTGSEAIVWGGANWFLNQPRALRNGARYDPLLDRWSPISSIGAPPARYFHAAVWTGEEMLVWGGTTDENDPAAVVSGGGRYDPALDAWSPLPAAGAPSARREPTAVWSGSEMILFGGRDASGASVNSGGRYDPVTDSWSPLDTSGAPADRVEHSAIWNGSAMLIFGGRSLTAGGSFTPLGDGARYDPQSDSWTAIASADAPSPRLDHSAVWNGSEMLIWGGTADPEDVLAFVRDGARYDPALDSWTAISDSGTPEWRAGHGAVWTGSAMLIWGGDRYTAAVYDDGALYDPVADSWTPMTVLEPPAARSQFPFVWTGSEFLLWGSGDNSSSPRNTGARYDPQADTWSPTGRGDAPLPRLSAGSVWTGSELIVWGGSDFGTYFADGGRYDPVLETWTPLPTLDAPPAAENPVAIWSGSEALFWGGYAGVAGYRNGGARYDPLTDLWTPINGVDAPTARTKSRAVWTGSEMIVWGGVERANYWNDGGRYDPANDSWTPLPTTGAPVGRWEHTAVWSGSEMLVWGGEGSGGGFLGNGARYAPATDSWSPISASGAPSARTLHAAVWTGDRMMIWGGDGGFFTGSLNNGSLYDPAADSWSGITTSGAPAGRIEHTLVWTGSVAIAWGGRNSQSGLNDEKADGGRYDPQSNSWSDTSTVDAPKNRFRHLAAWTGDSMLVWAGDAIDTGGRYFAGNPDLDGDGLADACDCAPADPGSTAAPGEVQRLRFGPDRQTVSWYSAAGEAGEDVTYDLVRGALGQWPVGSGIDETCIAADAPGTSAVDGDLPAAAAGFWYLARPRNACGLGSLGNDGSGTPRAGIACP
ncbi:hypothetical protein ABI59_17260 [Acidobacteria bacterium Mor1]|nr:hypothetical protein ABI59_17260 [Acidobacteria bacterium Mor1]